MIAFGRSGISPWIVIPIVVTILSIRLWMVSRLLADRRRRRAKRRAQAPTE
jgi:hypothetical protein